ncbi:hypothetical protein P168DRAFT_299090 [Aspergillus campestris IBT 28561]|uniref:Extracellular mutant protein 11 C-terminal domain-containing protein n=1 Tax=Aspergillus campestris (strain IBT 28561) TaxID=1392248 RepID=A0A2I1CV61_ASPC2|nr:uncharacterized protein P168DRAFT_299090 [Aspergillus campestris IBT 28561]PKY01494.1 hypothetical protein P168DRAFT_299090 [Aspergillus campestris IBT 28561]
MASAPSASAFSLPLPSWQQPLSVRAAQYESKKRKKDRDGWSDDDDNGETTDAASEIAPPAPSLTLSPDEARQYRIAGLSFDQEIPGGHFPHGPAKEGRAKGARHNHLLHELSSLSSPLYPPQSAAHRGNLRLQHISVLSNILHRCLLERDYVRAGRAWGLIIREEFRGVPVDVRTGGRWGIGAEILLQRGRQISDEAGRAPDDDTGRDIGPAGLCFTRKGFEEAKEYYERMVVQHPFRKSAPDAVSSMQFYPAMFGLWVYVTQEESKFAREEIRIEHEDAGEFSEEEDTASDIGGQAGSKQKIRALIAGVRARELDEAGKIAARLDELLMSFPYSDSPELLELRGMISLWIGDLHVYSLPQGAGGHYLDEGDGSDEDRMPVEETLESVQDRRERRLAAEKRQTEVRKSREYFEKAKKRGKGMTSTLKDFHIDDDSTRKMGVGDYVHSKEAIQLRPSVKEPPHRTRQQLADQARFDIPPTTRVAPAPMPLNRHLQRDNYGAASIDGPPHSEAETIQQRDMFDTDVEGVDDSTIAATSILGIDELRPTQLSPAATAQHQGIDPQPMYQYHQGAHSFDPQWYDNLGDKAMKSAGFSSEDGGDDNASQLTSMAGDDEQSEATNGSPDHFHRRRHADEPLSRRLQSFWNASRKSQAQPDHHQEEQHPEPSKTPAFDRSTSSDPRITSHIPVSTNRKPALPHTMSTTPRTRFSPPKPSLLDKLGDRTPTRRSSGPRPQPQPQPSRQQPSMPAPDPSDADREEAANMGSFSMDFGLNRGSNNPSLTAFDMTNLDGLDNDYSYDEYDPFSRRSSVRRIVEPNHNDEPNNNNNPSSSTRAQKKRLFEADYSPQELHQKTFDSLQSEPFDHDPAAARALHPTQEVEAPDNNNNTSPEDKLAFLSRLSNSDRDAYFSNLTMNEWEDCGDVLVEQFSSMLKKMKDLRHARRKTAAVFEAEVKRRHETVEIQSEELSRKFEEMRSGGAEVLRGRTP